MLVALAQWAGQTVAAAAVTDVWEAVRGRFAGLLGRGDARKAKVAERWLGQTRDQLAAAAPNAALEQVREALEERWAGRFADLLDEALPLRRNRALVQEVAAQLPAGAGSAADHSVAAGRDVNIMAAAGGIAAGVIRGNVAPPALRRRVRRSRSRTRDVEPGPWGGGSRPGRDSNRHAGLPAAAGGTRPAGAAGARPVFLAGREELLAELDARLAGGPGRG